MSAAAWSFYRLDTGLGTGVLFTGPEWMLADNTPEGCGAMPGGFDPSKARVQHVTDDFGDQVPTLVPYVPPRPADDEWQTWAWDDSAWQWVPSATLAKRKADRIAIVQREIDALEAQQLRPQRDVLNALTTGQAPPAAAVERLQEVEASIVPLRETRAALAAATTVAELNAVS